MAASEPDMNREEIAGGGKMACKQVEAASPRSAPDSVRTICVLRLWRGSAANSER